MSHARTPWLAALALLLAAGCPSTNDDGASSPTPTAPPTATGERYVPNGYNGIGWLTPKSEIERVIKNLTRPANAKSNVLVRNHELNHHPAAEAWFFDDDDQLIEVELRLKPKLTPEQSAELAMWLDSRFGPHEITLSNETRYQFVWSGADTEVYFTYDITNAVPDAPHVAFTFRNPNAASNGTGPTPAEQFAADALKALSEGWNVADVVSGKTRFVLIIAQGGERQKLMLDLDSKTGHTIGYKREPPYSAGTIARAQRDAEKTLSIRLATVGGPIAVIERDGVAYLIFSHGSYIALTPGADNIFKEAAGSLPPFLDELELPTVPPVDTPEVVETAVP